MKVACENPLTCECTPCLKAAKLRSDVYSHNFYTERNFARKELNSANELLLKSAQLLNYILFRSDDTWKLFPEYQIHSLLRQLPPLPDDEA